MVPFGRDRGLRVSFQTRPIMQYGTWTGRGERGRSLLDCSPAPAAITSFLRRASKLRTTIDGGFGGVPGSASGHRSMSPRPHMHLYHLLPCLQRHSTASRLQRRAAGARAAAALPCAVRTLLADFLGASGTRAEYCQAVDPDSA